MAAVLFQLITLPVEINASQRAMAALRSGGILTEEELPMAKKVLTAAAMTYIAATLMALS
jgi:Zn-dependent membrane protease YugP